VVTDLPPDGEYDDIGAGTLCFSLDSKHLAYIAKNGGKYFVIIDGWPDQEFDHIVLGNAKLTFDKGGKLAYLAVKDNTLFRVWHDKL
jgi:hypothetical protein